MKVLITGANGQLGSEIKELAFEYENLECVFKDLPELDICDTDALNTFIIDQHINAVINCAGYTAVDIRDGSETYGEHVTVELSGENKKQVFIPRGFAHGFLVLSNTAIVTYKVDNSYAPTHDAGIRWDDSILNIQWGVNESEVLVSEKDAKLPFFSEFETPFTT